MIYMYTVGINNQSTSIFYETTDLGMYVGTSVCSNKMDEWSYVCMNPLEDKKIVRMRNGSLPIIQWDLAFPHREWIITSTRVKKNFSIVRQECKEDEQVDYVSQQRKTSSPGGIYSPTAAVQEVPALGFQEVYNGYYHKPGGF